MFKKSIITLFISFTFLTSPSLAESGYINYQNSEFAYSVDYPIDWEKEENEAYQLTMFRSPAEDSEDNFSENTNIIVEKASGYSLEEYFQANIKNMSSTDGLKNFEIIKQGTKKVNNKNSIFIIYTHIYNEIPLKVKAYFFSDNKNGYVVTSTASPDTFSKYEAIFDSIVNSFIIK